MRFMNVFGGSARLRDQFSPWLISLALILYTMAGLFRYLITRRSVTAEHSVA